MLRFNRRWCISMKSHEQDGLLVSDPMIWHVCYLLQVLGYFTLLTWVIAFIIGLMKRKEVMHDPLLYTHATWQIHTFSYALLWTVVSALLFWLGFATLFIGIGFIFMAIGVGLGIVNFIWIIYRIAYGWIKLYEHQPVHIRVRI